MTPTNRRALHLLPQAVTAKRAVCDAARVVGASGVEGKAESGKWWPVSITTVHPDGSFDLTVDDEPKTKWCKTPSENVRMLHV